MAKKSMIARDKKRLALIAKYADKRAELKELVIASIKEHLEYESADGAMLTSKNRFFELLGWFVSGFKFPDCCPGIA